MTSELLCSVSWLEVDCPDGLQVSCKRLLHGLHHNAEPVLLSHTTTPSAVSNNVPGNGLLSLTDLCHSTCLAAGQL